uniref:Putative secreted peptide n=1 Tax=Anopheles braziliensis TaxID=58242 RepID=A0A2M3ZUB4_9DIPT
MKSLFVVFLAFRCVLVSFCFPFFHPFSYASVLSIYLSLFIFDVCVCCVLQTDLRLRLLSLSSSYCLRA